MDISNTVLTEAVSPPEVLPYVKGIENASDEQKKKLAEDFESLLIGTNGHVEGEASGWELDGLLRR